MCRVRSVVLALMLAALLGACAPAAPVPTAVPTLTATVAPTLTPTLTLVPTATETLTPQPTITATQEDFSDLHPEQTIEAALKSEHVLKREDLARAVRKALAEATPFSDSVVPTTYMVVKSSTGVENVEYVKQASYSTNPETIPCSIEGIYPFMDIPQIGRKGVLILARYPTPEGDRIITYLFEPSLDKYHQVVDQHVIITPMLPRVITDSEREILDKYPDEKSGMSTLAMKYRDQVVEDIQVWITTGKISEDLWKTPLVPNTDFKELREQ